MMDKSSRYPVPRAIRRAGNDLAQQFLPGAGRHQRRMTEDVIRAAIRDAYISGWIDGTYTDDLDAEDDVAPPCAASMGCLCAGHARGNPASAPCDTSEEVLP